MTNLSNNAAIASHSNPNALETAAQLTSQLVVSVSEQTMRHYHHGELLKTYTVSTAENGIGSTEGSGKTPLGRHIIGSKIGGDQPINAVFIARVPTGEVYSEELAAAYPERDWILSRILRLEGCEEGLNKGVDANGVCCDTYERYVYIHGTPDSEPMGIPLSFGCIRMRNQDIIELFEQVFEGTVVDIVV